VPEELLEGLAIFSQAFSKSENHLIYLKWNKSAAANLNLSSGGDRHLSLQPVNQTKARLIANDRDL